MLYEFGLKGEEVKDDRVWIVKSHFPERQGSSMNFNRCIVLVRSPLDCIASLFNMMATQKHDISMEKEELDKAIELGIWDEYMR